MTPTAQLDGKVAIVTGAGQGIGRGIALAMAKEGAKVAIAELNPETGTAVAEELRALGASAVALLCDVADRAAVDSAVAATVEEFGTVDVVVNNAQYLDHIDMPLMEMTESDMRRQLDVGLMGTFSFMQACFPHMQSHGGKVINIASGVGVMGKENFASYAAAKEAIRGLSRTAAREWGRFGINVNILCPAAPTPSAMAWAARQPPDALSAGHSAPIPRLGDAEDDVGRVAVFLASSASDYITGHTFMVDGGRSIDAGR